MPQGNETGQGASADAVGSVDGSVGAAGFKYGNSAQARSIGYEEETSPTLSGAPGGNEIPTVVYSFDSLSSNSMKSSNPFSGCRAVEVAKCIDTTYPDPSKNQGGVAVVECIAFAADKASTLRAGAGAPKHMADILGRLVVLNDQGGSSINVESEEISPTLRANSHQHEPVIALQAKQQSLATTEECANTLGANDWKEPQVIALQANGIDRADTAGCNGAGWRENESYTLNTIDRHAVCFENHQHGGYREGCGTLRASGGDYGGGSENVVCYDARGNGDGETVLFEPRSPDGEPRIYDDICPTLNTAQGGQRQPCVVQETLCFNEGQITSPTNGNNPQWNEPCHTLSATDNRAPTVILKRPPRKYIIRRLTPTECARLQGFPDNWGHLAPYNPADADFWEDVRKTHAEITGKTYKPTKNLKKWYEGLHTDSAEYKMWGNGIALPNAEYVIHGIAEQGAKTLGSLFDGSGGFPLAGVLSGIKPVWASEVEPYPIAVTKSRFKEEQ